MEDKNRKGNDWTGSSYGGNESWGAKYDDPPQQWGMQQLEQTESWRKNEQWKEGQEWSRRDAPYVENKGTTENMEF